MTDRPLIFSGPMVRALLDGRKTMTRRPLKIPRGWKCENLAEIDPHKFSGRADDPYSWGDSFADDGAPLALPDFAKLQFRTGDRLWVRETVACGACAPSKPSHWSPGFWRREQGTAKNPSGLWYKADGRSPEKTITDRGKWVSSRFMPRWASRLTLVVTAVKVERLQEISEEDAIAEGLAAWAGEAAAPRAAFCLLWDKLNATRAPWDSNPFVVALTFTVHKQNIDSLPKQEAA